MSGSAFAILTRHFIAAIAAPRLLTDLGVDFLRRTAAGVIGILFVSGIFLTRALFKKYTDLYASWNETAYLRAVESDSLLMIGLPMLVIALAAVLIAPTLFPDDTDYRVLSPLPLPRLTIFAAKLAAAAIVVITLVLAVNMLASLWFPVATGGRWMPYSLARRVAAHAAATISGSLWAFSAVMAAQGLCLAAAPRSVRARLTLVVQATIFVTLLLAIPYVLHLSTIDASNDAIARPPLAWVPAAWFLGLERWLLDPAAAGYAAAARIAAWASLSSITLLALCYARLYRDAESLAFAFAPLALRRAKAAGAAWALRHDTSNRAAHLAQQTRAVLAFAFTVLTRSRLHQTVFLLIAGIGFAILIGQTLTVFAGTSAWAARPHAAVHAALSAPLLVGLAITLALRAAFLLPADQRAVWVFRLTETPSTRAQWLDGAVLALVLAATVPALITAAVLQPYVLGWRWLAAAVLTTLAHLLLVEIVLRDWARVPFTCSYLPGKRVLAFTLGLLLGTYFIYVYIGAHLLRWSIAHPSRLVFTGGVVLAAFVTMRHARQQTWGMQPLEFDDDDPAAIRTLNLLPDER
jgi:hypothetical protein